MKTPLIFIMSLAVMLLSSCSTKQSKLTTASVVVEDITTGSLNSTVMVVLEEIETPKQPFSSLVVTRLKEFELAIDEEIEIEFHARRGDRFEYVFAVVPFGSNYSSGLISVNQDYEVVGSCTLMKKEQQSCRLKIEPTAEVNILIENKAANGGEQNDSIFVHLTDGNIEIIQTHMGLGSSPLSNLKLPHGNYELTAKRFREGSQIDEKVENWEFVYNQPSAINVSF
ncbi:MAG: hypothetical protein RLP15_12945 [Cryomorphaceae bacterium]